MDLELAELRPLRWFSFVLQTFFTPSQNADLLVFLDGCTNVAVSSEPEAAEIAPSPAERCADNLSA